MSRTESVTFFVTNNISKVAKNIDWVMPFGQFGDVCSSSRYIAAETYNKTTQVKLFLKENL